MDRADRLRAWDRADRPIVTPSLLACDFARVADELDALKAVGVEAVHLDVMDGHFVPNLSYGAPVIGDWRKRTGFFFDTHLMISEPGRYLDDFLKAGCDQVIFHIEVEPDPTATLRRIRAAGCRAALAINPKTPVEAVVPFLGELDSILVMSVEPGFGGQSFDPNAVAKVRALRKVRPDLEIGIDGGINPTTAPSVVEAGANQLVAGSAIFRPDGDYGASFGALSAAARSGLSRGGGPADPGRPASNP